MLKERSIFVAILLFAFGVFVIDVFLLPGIILPGPPYFVPVMIAAYFLPPRMTVGVAGVATALRVVSDLSKQTPLWLMFLYFVAVVLISYLGVQLSSRMRREAALAEERERYLARLDTLLSASSRILGQTTLQGLLQAAADGARQLSSARIAIAGHGYAGGSFRLGAASHASGAVSCPPGQEFKVERGGVHLDLIEKRDSIRLTDEEMRSHPDWWGLPPNHGPLRGLLGSRLSGRDGQAAGLLMVTDKEHGEFAPEDETLLRQLAALASLGLQHIEAREDAEGRAAELDVSNKELESFAYSVAHDLRAPLRHINGFGRILLDEYADSLDERAKGYLEIMRQASQRMGQLIDDLLNLSRVTRAEICRELIDLSDIAQAVAAELCKEQPQRRVEFTVAPEIKADGDPRLVRIVLENLLVNAWKFTANRPVARIEFGLARQDGKHVYYVRDNGAGFDPAYGGKLFGAFQRLHRTDEYPGTGIGLATVQRIIQRHGGRVWAEGAVDQGATFYFTL